MTPTEMRVDPITLSVIWNRLDSLCDEAGERVIFAAQSFVMGNARDLGTTFLDEKGRFVSVSAYLPIHVFGADRQIQAILDKFGGAFKPGDLIIGNDPYIVAAGHLPDWIFVRPAFYKDELVGFFYLRGHMADTGGFQPGGYAAGAFDIIAEGLNIPPIKFLDGGKENVPLSDLLFRNLRNPQQNRMDIFSIAGALQACCDGLARLCDKYGLEMVKATMEEMLSMGERAIRAEISKIQDGEYYGDRACDWDGQTDRQVHVRCKVIVAGDELTIDLSESDPQCEFVNSPEGNTQQAALTAVMSLIDTRVPLNHGSMSRAIKIITKPGTVCEPNYPATVGACALNVGTQIVEAVQQALMQATFPTTGRSFGATGRHLCPLIVGTEPTRIDPRTGAPVSYFTGTFASDPGFGGRRGFDGWTGIMTWSQAGSLTRPQMEVIESIVNVRQMAYEILIDSEGAGEFRGSPGCYCVTENCSPGLSYLESGNSDGEYEKAWGFNGGQEPPGFGKMVVVSPDGKERRFRPNALERWYQGEKLVIWSHGGGGWGDPLDRKPESVLKDVQDRVVSLGRAHDVYGVVIDENSWTIDRAATEAVRKERKAAKAAAAKASQA
jgi:N-methylhydantoinase B